MSKAQHMIAGQPWPYKKTKVSGTQKTQFERAVAWLNGLEGVFRVVNDCAIYEPHVIWRSVETGDIVAAAYNVIERCRVVGYVLRVFPDLPVSPPSTTE